MNQETTVPQPAAILDNDDMPIGRILSRREVLALIGATSVTTLLSACAPIRPNGGQADAISSSVETAATTDTTMTCVVRPALTEGPLFVDEMLNRADIRADPTTGQVSEGVQLDLTFHVTRLNADACTPLAGVQVDVWHCDAHGVYSDTNQLGFQTVGQKFLRGYQVTDESGVVKFTTIYPGWYQGRAVHIHFKMRTGDGYDFTSQLFFDESLNDAVFAQAPYNSRGARTLRNENDGIFRQGGNQLLLTVDQVDTGYAATFAVALDLS
ncbi:MAG: intradiol ring-cleavage dioxygenase [Caldilineaceae bacterium]